MTKGFKCWLAEALGIHGDRIDTNPSTSRVLGRLHNSEHGILRYLHNTKTGATHVGDAAHHTHTELSIHTGEHDFHRNWEGEPMHYNADHYHAGMIYTDHADAIKKQGFHNWMKAKHTGLPNANTWE